MDDLATRIGRAGLKSLMADPRYHDAGHPEHDPVVDTVARAFEILFGRTGERARRNPRTRRPAPRPGLLAEVLNRAPAGARAFDDAPKDEQARMGRGALVRALGADGFPLPTGLANADTGPGPDRAASRRAPLESPPSAPAPLPDAGLTPVTEPVPVAAAKAFAAERHQQAQAESEPNPEPKAKSRAGHDSPPAEGPSAPAQSGRPLSRGEGFESELPPPTDEEIDPRKMYERLDFDPRGCSEATQALLNPLDARSAAKSAEEAIELTNKHFSNTPQHNDEADAFRHAVWSYKLTRKLGAKNAKEFTDAHEVTGSANSSAPSGLIMRQAPNSEGETLMDLYNNAVGRQLATEPRNENRSAEEAVMEALRDGRLQTQTFKILGENRSIRLRKRP